MAKALILKGYTIVDATLICIIVLRNRSFFRFVNSKKEASELASLITVYAVDLRYLFLHKAGLKFRLN